MCGPKPLKNAMRFFSMAKSAPNDDRLGMSELCLDDANLTFLLLPLKIRAHRQKLNFNQAEVAGFGH